MALEATRGSVAVTAQDADWNYRVARWAPAGLLWLSAVTCLIAWGSYGPAWTLRAASLANLEFMGVFGGGLVFFILGIGADRWQGRVVLTSLALLCLGLFLKGAFDDFGFAGALDLLVIIFVTYSGVLFAGSPARREQAIAELVLRLLLALIVLMFAANVSGLPKEVDSWGTAREALICSAIYFGLLGCVEATGMFAAMRRHWPEKPPARLSRLEIDERQRRARDAARGRDPR